MIHVKNFMLLASIAIYCTNSMLYAFSIHNRSHASILIERIDVASDYGLDEQHITTQELDIPIAANTNIESSELHVGPSIQSVTLKTPHGTYRLHIPTHTEHGTITISNTAIQTTGGIQVHKQEKRLQPHMHEAIGAFLL